MRRWSLPLLAAGLLICVVVFILLSERSASAQERTCAVVTNCFGEATEDINLYGLIQKNEMIFFVAFILVLMASYTVGAILVRGWRFARARNQTREFLLKIADALYYHRTNEAVALAAQYPKSPVAALVCAALQSHVNAPRDESKAIKPSMHEWQRMLVVKTVEIKQRLWMLAAVGWTAPLVGLFYASLGICQAMWGWYNAEGYYFAPYASGIAQAMWGVLFSILIAVPAIWMHKYFAAQAETFVLEMDRLSLALVDQMVSASENRLQPATGARYLTQELHPLPTHRLAD